MVVRTALLCAGMLMLPAVCFGQVYKCTDAAGKVSYQSIPCTGVKQDQPVILKSPTLTNKEKFNAAAYAAGTTPEEAERQIRAAQQGGNQQPAQQQAPQPVPQTHDQATGAYRCTRVDGTTFVRATPCPKTASVTVNGTTVTGVQASGSLSGRVEQESISKEQACTEAKQQLARAEAMHKSQGRTMPDEFRKSLESNIRSVCR